MKIVSVTLAGTLRWNVHLNDPITFPAIPSLEITVINPLARGMKQQHSIPSTYPLSDGRIHVIANQFYLIIPDELNLDDCRLITNWLRILRIVSRQSMLPTDCIAMGISGSDEKLSIEHPKLTTSFQLIGSYRVNTAIDAAVLAKAAQISSDSNFPIYHEILLDALAALEKNDYRQAVLYSAIAVESLARTSLDAAYQSAITSQQPPIHLNIREFTQAGGVAKKKDPIFSLLFESENFSRLLHECPLYLTRKSLLFDNESLYRDAINLYRTRNRLSHGHIIPENNNESLLSIDSGGAFNGLDIAIKVFDWHGETGYRLPRLDVYEDRREK